MSFPSHSPPTLSPPLSAWAMTEKITNTISTNCKQYVGGDFFFSEVVNIKYDLIYKKSKAVCVSKSCVSVSLSLSWNKQRKCIHFLEAFKKQTVNNTRVVFASFIQSVSHPSSKHGLSKCWPAETDWLKQGLKQENMSRHHIRVTADSGWFRWIAQKEQF